MDEQSAEQAHLVRIEHDTESHAFAADCHDDCKASLVCPGVTDACRTWWECVRCRKVVARLDEDGALDYDERLDQRGEAHGVEHLRIDGMWTTPSSQCLSASCDEHDASELIPTLPDGDYPVLFDWEEGYVEVRLIDPAPSLPPAVVTGDADA